MANWSYLGFLSELVSTSTSLAWSLKASSPSKTMCVILFPVSLRELVFWTWWNVYLWTPLCYFVAILHLFSQSLSIVLWCGGQLLNVTFSFFSASCICMVDWLCPDQNFLSLCHLLRAAGLIMLYKVNSNSNHCLFSEQQSVSPRVRHTRAAAAANPLEFEVSRCRTSQFARSFLPAQVRLWNDLPYNVFDPGTLEGSRVQSTAGCFPELCFLVGLCFLVSCVFPELCFLVPCTCGAGACGVAKAIYEQLCFSHLGIWC